MLIDTVIRDAAAAASVLALNGGTHLKSVV